MIKAGGNSYVSSPPAFSNDATKLLICTGNTVSIFSTSTGLQINELQGHGSQVTSVVVVPAVNAPASKIICYCWTSSLDGTIRHWDFSVPKLLKTTDIRFPIYSMVIPGLLNKSVNHSEKPFGLFAYICTAKVNQTDQQSKDSCWPIRKCNLSQSRLSGGVILAETSKPRIISISPAGDFIGMSEKRALRIWQIPSTDSDNVLFKKTRLHHTKTLTTIAFHPSERVVAAGDSTGRILIWRNFGNDTFTAAGTKLSTRGLSRDAEENPGVRGNDDAESCTVWHWHAAQVNVLFFSSDGAYLYSGGKEGVLVLWQLDTGKKKFLPRIGSPLLYFTSSPDPSIACLACADNVVHLLKMPSLDILRSVSGIKPRLSAIELFMDSCSGIVFNNSNGIVGVCTDNYCIQFYSLLHDREVSQVQICERNHQPGDEVTVIVNLVALSSDGSIMSTVETRLPEDGIGGLVCLKLWERSSENKDFCLSTVVYEPHREAGISDIVFHPNQKMVVSCSYGADFKVWVFRSDAPKDQTHQSRGWTCHAVGSYKYKPLTAAAFSADGSVLAVAAERVITLWDPIKNFLVAVIGETHEPIVTLSFVGKSEYLVSTSRGLNPQVSVWTTSNLSILWSYKLRAEGISCATDGSSFAVLALVPPSSKNRESVKDNVDDGDGAILIFNVENPVPVSSWFVRKAQGGGLGFVQTTSGLDENGVDEKSSEVLAYMNCLHEFVLLDIHGDQSNINVSRPLIRPESIETGKSGYESIYGEVALMESRKSGKEKVGLTAMGRPWESIFSGPSHVLPDLTNLCSTFLESLLERRSITSSSSSSSSYIN